MHRSSNILNLFVVTMVKTHLKYICLRDARTKRINAYLYLAIMYIYGRNISLNLFIHAIFIFQKVAFNTSFCCHELNYSVKIILSPISYVLWSPYWNVLKGVSPPGLLARCFQWLTRPVFRIDGAQHAYSPLKPLASFGYQHKLVQLVWLMNVPFTCDVVIAWRTCCILLSWVIFWKADMKQLDNELDNVVVISKKNVEISI